MTNKHPLESLLEESRKTDPENIFRGYRMFLDHISGTDFAADLGNKGTYLRVLYYYVVEGRKDIDDTYFSREVIEEDFPSDFINHLEKLYHESSGEYIKRIDGSFSSPLSRLIKSESKYSYHIIKYFFDPFKYLKNLKEFTKYKRISEEFEHAKSNEAYEKRMKSGNDKKFKKYSDKSFKLRKKAYTKIGEPRSIIVVYLGQSFERWEKGDPLEPEFKRKLPISNYVLPRSRIILYKNPKTDIMNALEFLEHKRIPLRIKKLENRLYNEDPSLGRLIID